MSVFSGLRVLDVASFVAAPAAATILADFGADVIKVEPPVTGDPYRQIVRLPNLPKAEHNYAWTLAARSKRGIAIDLGTLDGRNVLHGLAERADVLITNYPPKVRQKLGLRYEDLSGMNPRLIYASLTGYGEVGPEADKPGFDAHAYWARSGMADLVRYSEDIPPASPTLGMGDQPTAAMFFGAIVTALYHRERTGHGSCVTTSLLASGVWSNGPTIQAALCGGTIPRRLPREACRSALTQCYRCGDGRWLVISLIDEVRDWPKLAEILGVTTLLGDPRFTTIEDRQRNVLALLEILDQRFATRAAQEWQACFNAERLTAAVIVRTEDAASDEQMLAAKALVASPHIPHSGLEVDSPFQISGIEKSKPRPAPSLGEHTDEVLLSHGFAPDRIAALRTARVIA